MALFERIDCAGRRVVAEAVRVSNKEGPVRLLADYTRCNLTIYTPIILFIVRRRKTLWRAL
jgi:hypothetical protein